MARGGPVKRTHTVSVRLTPDERAAWDELRTAAGRRELGAWVRDVVNDIVAGHEAAGAPDVAGQTAGREGGTRGVTSVPRGTPPPATSPARAVPGGTTPKDHAG